MSQKFFSEFLPTNKNQWKQQAIKDLKGKDFDATLLWKSPENIVVQPYYAAEDLEKLSLEAIQNAQLSKNTLGWQNCPRIKFNDEKNTNSLIINTLQKGAEAILLDFSEATIQDVNLVKILDKIKLSETPIIFRVQGQSEELIENLQKFIQYQIKGSIQDDALATWMTTGKWLNDSWKNTKNCFQLTKNSPKFQVVTVESHHFHHAGATAVQELAFTLASAVTYLDKLTDEGLNFEEILPKMAFSISIGTDYFMEIAKIRALRLLWEKVVFGFAQTTKSSLRLRSDSEIRTPKSQIHAQTSTFYDAALSPYTNMLRATTEAMAAVIGGCDSLTIHPFDAVFKENSDDFSERIARNISVLMKEEAHLDKTNDPAAGSYFLENLTNDLANAAWKLFLEVEKMGGIMAAFEAGFVQNEIEKSYNLQIEKLQNGKVMVGVNKFWEDDIFPQNVDNQEVMNSSNLKLLKNRRISEIFEK